MSIGARILAWTILIAVAGGIAIGGMWLYDTYPTLIRAAAVPVGFFTIGIGGIWAWAIARSHIEDRRYRREERTREIVRSELQRKAN